MHDTERQILIGTQQIQVPEQNCGAAGNIGGKWTINQVDGKISDHAALPRSMGFCELSG